MFQTERDKSVKNVKLLRSYK